MPDQPRLDHLPPALHEPTRQLWEQLQHAARQAGVDLPEDRHRELTRILATSEFAARSLIRRPTLVTALFEPGELDHGRSTDDYHHRLQPLLGGCPDEAALMTALRDFRRYETVRIAWRDLAGEAPVTAILAELSGLADALLDSTLKHLHQQLCERFGTPRDRDGAAQQLVVLGMGKLGGEELNFSSDIDLIFAYPHNGETDGRRSLSNEEFFRRLGQKLIKVLNEVTADGFVYRIDMRLRPFGDTGPLAIPFSAMEDYYQTHGREWERYALIKARVVAGDRTAGEQLLKALQPFVYRRYLDYGAFESLREMKTLIAREIDRKGLKRNIKLGPGGIREVEFIGQAFQLIHGGREPELRCRQLLSVLDYLARSERLPQRTVDELKQAYAFLRRSENRLQAWADQQTHELPTEDLAKLRLAHAMGYASWRDYVSELNHHARRVEEQFEMVFAAPQTENASDDDWKVLWSEAPDDEQLRRLLTQHGFDDAERACKALQNLRGSFGYRTLGQRGYQRLQQLLPLLLEATTGTEHPALTLERLTRLLEAIVRRSAYLALLLENPLALSQLVQLCSASPWIAHYLSQHPLLLDELLDPTHLYRPLDRKRLGQELDRELSRIATDDPEQRLEILRHFKQSQTLHVAAADLADAMPLMIVSDHLTEIAEVLLEKILALAWDDLLARFGRPGCRVDGEPRQPGLAIIGYGKLGGIELGYGSDLDLVFLHDSRGEQQQTDGQRQVDNATFFAKLVQRITHMLNARTPAGQLYEADTRLRPSGRSGLLVSSVEAFATYQREQAWTWEHQALVRARCIAGTPAIAERFTAIRRDILCRPRDPDTLRGEVRDMRERMRRELDKSREGRFHLKQGHGGMIDIEFMVQYLILAHAHDHPALITRSDNIRQLDALEQAGLLDTDDAEQLREIYRKLRRRSHRLKLQEQPSLVPDTEFTAERAVVRALWQRHVDRSSAGS